MSAGASITLEWDRGRAMALNVKPFEISCKLATPRERVWQAWTERRQLMKWFGPKGFTMPAAKLGFFPGGSFHYCLCSPQGEEMWGKWTFREIEIPERLVLVHSFSDEDAGMARNPHNPDWPLEILSTILLEEMDGGTRVTIHCSPIDARVAEYQIFEAAHAAMLQGWTGTFEQMTEYLSKLE